MEPKAISVMNQEFVKLDQFDRINFIIWKDKMLFLFTALKISYVQDPNLPTPTPQDTDQVKAKYRLYNLFTSKSSPKEIWKALEYKYNIEK
ncbi:hypothetical protein MANES_12G067451v8 [Manihot esculenta]|uniref:Uncharacterized protein n=1 Tax=Manihot esculenta TaxID=3983 RepID=A0A2C9UTZ3_MANES|nr:hypothetical protein MANES_12G067451v8 [Manihot esculenta]